ncbi:MAG: 1-deoxy-D-xylulose-5-phosphate reductoisomerase [Spirochaetaceae bacterium]|jgi:1-deoxy-D-xylulose-5-phosphate reductoisomerase|nr:1-deoxy-D-xylulose-5-phosphate reductoisomerase [Spirochaetaceae bacterium]
MKKRIAVLGATGSIGRSALDVIRADKEHFEPVLFSANSNADALFELATEFSSAKIAFSGQLGTDRLEFFGVDRRRVYSGYNGLLAAIDDAGAELTLNGISGAAGLRPSLAALEAGSALALANKESMVMAGRLVLETAAIRSLPVIPVDSEHSAVFNLLRFRDKNALKEILLTASGGPFRMWNADRLKKARPEDALAHPTWNMGAKITIDSASLANKGLEVIEAARLFSVEADRIKVVVHPQSIVHSMVRMADGAVYAQLSWPDMRLPIHEALHYPDMARSAWGVLDFEGLNLTFEKPDFERFPMLGMAYHALRAGERYTIAYNAANEYAVDAFLGGKIGFTDISVLCGRVLNKEWGGEASDLQAIMDTDRLARESAAALVKGLERQV